MYSSIQRRKVEMNEFPDIIFAYPIINDCSAGTYQAVEAYQRDCKYIRLDFVEKKVNAFPALV